MYSKYCFLTIAYCWNNNKLLSKTTLRMHLNLGGLHESSPWRTSWFPIPSLYQPHILQYRLHLPSTSHAPSAGCIPSLSASEKRLSLGGGVYLSEYDISKNVMYYNTLTSIRESSYSYVLCKKKLENIHNLLTKGKQIMKW